MINLFEVVENKKDKFEEQLRDAKRKTVKKEAYYGAKYSIFPFSLERFVDENGQEDQEENCTAFYYFSSLGKISYYYDGVNGYHYFMEYKPEYDFITVYNYNKEIHALYHIPKQKSLPQYTEYLEIGSDSIKKEVYEYNEENKISRVINPLDASFKGPIDNTKNYFEIEYDLNGEVKSLRYPMSYYGGGYLYYNLDSFEEFKLKEKVVKFYVDFFFKEISNTLEAEDNSLLIELEFTTHEEYHTILDFKLKAMFKAKREQIYEETVYYNGEEYFTEYYVMELEEKEEIDAAIYQQWIVREGRWKEESRAVALETERKLRDKLKNKISDDYRFKGIDTY